MPSVLSIPLPIDIHDPLELFSMMSRVFKEHPCHHQLRMDAKLIASMVESGHLAHGHLTEEFGKGITLDTIIDFVIYLWNPYSESVINILTIVLQLQEFYYYSIFIEEALCQCKKHQVYSPYLY